MKTLVIGATGATGRLLVAQLLSQGQQVKAVVRSPKNFPKQILDHENLSIIQGTVLDMGENELINHISDCSAIASCLGHNLTFKGLFGKPRYLVTDSVRRLCAAVNTNQPTTPIKFVLMNTTGNKNRDLAEKIPFSQKAVVALVRLLIPPHRDNEAATNYLRLEVGQNDKYIEWAAVRPDSLVDEDQVTEYSLHPSPTRNAIFNSGRSSRINVGHFMGQLIADNALWENWKGQMPVIYNKN